jgi:hypothetical protein
MPGILAEGKRKEKKNLPSTAGLFSIMREDFCFSTRRKERGSVLPTLSFFRIGAMPSHGNGRQRIFAGK